MINASSQHPSFRSLPPGVTEVLETFRQSGREAYLVGGCVRDLLMGRVPNDYDVTTSALPEETEAIFSGRRVVENGIKHGTVTVLMDDLPIEVTTFRSDGTYSDGRHPDSVSFARTVEEDLRRRDFTVNAIAYRPETGILDPWGGTEDLKNGILRCVGDPKERFGEDALRILRLARFVSKLGFAPEAATAEAAVEMRERLRLVSAERVYAECTKLLCGDYAERALLKFHAVLSVWLPELGACVGFPQITNYHCYDVYTHTCKVVSGVRPDPVLRWAALLHDIAKPACHEFYDGRSHFRGHAVQGEEMAGTILHRLRAENRLTAAVRTLVRRHDDLTDGSRTRTLRLLSKIGPENALLLTELMEADNEAKSELGRRAVPRVRAMREQINELLESGACLHVSDLAVHGDDLIAAGMRPGAPMGKCLETLLGEVQEGILPNEREALLERAKALKQTH